MSSLRLLLPTALLLVAAVGCGSAHLVHATPDGGVVAMPSNSDSWPFYHRQEAEKLMAQRCPNGYQIVEERLERRGDQPEYRITFRGIDVPSPAPPGPPVRTVSAQVPAPPASPATLPPRPIPVTMP
jgi:hypothetical protein